MRQVEEKWDICEKKKSGKEIYACKIQGVVGLVVLEDCCRGQSG